MIGNLKVPTIFTAVDKVSKTVEGMQKKTTSFQKSLNKVANYAAVGGVALLSFFGYAANEAIKFEDRLADVAKTTGLSGKALEAYGNDVLNLAKITRSSKDDLLTIGVVGGQMAVPTEQLAKFTEEANKFGVALGSDFSGGVEEAITQVAKINKLFSDTKGLEISESITRAGSAMNFLSSKGTATAQNMNDFVLRMGAMPEALKPSFQATVALGAMLQELGIDSERGASGVKNLLTTAAKELPSYAKQMGLSVKQAQDLLATDPSQFLANFSKSLNGLKPDVLAKKLKTFKVNSLETIAVVGQLSGNTELYTQKLGFATQAFREATSLQEEYNTKNETTAAKIQIAKNNFEAFAIMVGVQLLPVLGELIEKVLPIVQSFMSWVSVNEDLIPLMAIFSAGIIGLKVAMIAYNMAMVAGKGIMIAYSVAKGIYMALFTQELVLTNANNVSKKAFIATSWAYLGVLKAVTAVQTFFAGAVWASLWPILLIILAIAAIIAIFYYWDEIVAWFSKQWEKFTNWIGELWDKVVKWFQEFSFMDFFKSIGNSIIDFMLLPLKSVLFLVAKIPGKIGEMAKTALAFTSELKFDVEPTQSAQLAPSTTAQVATNESITTNNSRMQVDFNDPNSQIKRVKQFGNPTPVFVNGTKFNE